MKPAKSTLILQFLRHVEQGLIVGKGETGSSGPEVLTEITEALRAVLQGVPPDEALEIEREGPGRSGDFYVALYMHQQRKRLRSWPEIIGEVNAWRAERRLPKYENAQAGMNLVRNHREAIDAYEARQASLQRLREKLKASR